MKGGSSQNTQTRGPLETFLSGLLSNNPDQANQPALRPEQPGNLHYNSQAPADAGPQVSCSFINWKGGGVP